MKKFIVISLMFVIAIVSNAQGIYTKVTKYDKFDDVVSKRTVKTLITKTDSTIVIETKGQKAQTYKYVDNEYFAVHMGSRNNLENLVADIYGYESQYYAFSKKIVTDIKNQVSADFKSAPDSIKTKENFQTMIALKLLSELDKVPTITFRTISRFQYSFEYATDLVWIKFEDGSRIIYEK